MEILMGHEKSCDCAVCDDIRMERELRKLRDDALNKLEAENSQLRWEVAALKRENKQLKTASRFRCDSD